MPSIICIKGPQNAGLDNWLSGLHKELCARGMKVGLILPGAGTGRGMVLNTGGLILQRPFDDEPGLMELSERYMAGLDLVISCAHPGDKKVKIAFIPDAACEALADDPGVKAVVSPAPLEHPAAWFAPEDVSGLAAFITDSLTPKREPARVRVLIDGKRLPIKDFIQDILANTNRGMLNSLRGGDKKGKLEIYID